MEVAGSNPAAPNGRGVGGQDANRRSLEWLFRKMLTDVAAAARSKFRSTIRSTKSAVLYDLGGFRRSPRACKSLKNLKRQDCHGRGRGFEPRRPRQILKGLSPFWHVTSKYKKVQVKNLGSNGKAWRGVQDNDRLPNLGACSASTMVWVDVLLI